MSFRITTANNILKPGNKIMQQNNPLVKEETIGNITKHCGRRLQVEIGGMPVMLVRQQQENYASEHIWRH